MNNHTPITPDDVDRAMKRAAPIDRTRRKKPEPESDAASTSPPVPAPASHHADDKPPPEPMTVSLANVASEVVEWLWRGRLAIGKVSIIGGHPDVGKTFWTADLAARVSAGRSFPDSPGAPNPAGGVLFVNGEDGLADTIKPRLAAAGADLSRVRAVPLLGEPGTARRPWFTLDDVPALERALAETPGCRLIIIDPVSAFLGECNDNANGEVRGLLGPLADLASRYRVAVVLISHPGKSPGVRAIHRILGSVGWIGAARSAWLVLRENGDGERRLFLKVKNNLAPDTPGLAYTIGGDPPRVQWEPEPVHMTADDALAAETATGEEQSAIDEAEAWLADRLAGGDVPGATVYDEAKAAGIRKRTLERAKRRLHVECAPTAFRGPWVWRLRRKTAPDSPQSATHGDMADCADSGEVDGPDYVGGIPI